MKRYKINNDFFVLVRDTPNNSNYTKSISLYNYKDSKSFICGTILNENSTKKDFIMWGLESIKKLNISDGYYVFLFTYENQWVQSTREVFKSVDEAKNYIGDQTHLKIFKMVQ